MLQQKFRTALRSTAKEFKAALWCFDPAAGRDNPYPERMFSYYYIRALTKALPDAKVLLEVPVTGRSKRGRDNHIDALIFNRDEMVLAEFKVGWAPSKWLSLDRDLERLTNPSVWREIRSGFYDCRPRREFIFLGADCWLWQRAIDWKSGVGLRNPVLPKAMRNSQRDFHRIYREKGSNYDGYYFTWAFIPHGKAAA